MRIFKSLKREYLKKYRPLLWMEKIGVNFPRGGISLW